MFDAVQKINEQPTGIHGPGGDQQKNQATTRLDHVWPETWSGMSKAAQRRLSTYGIQMVSSLHGKM